MRLSSAAFKDEERIPDRFTCEGEDISPPLTIEGVDPEAESLVLIVDDPDAPTGVFNHWLVWNIPTDRTQIPPGIPRTGVPKELEGAIQGENDFGELDYRGPCPPGNVEHEYRFNLYALDRRLELEPGAGRQRLQEAMEGHVIEKTVLKGTYSR